MREVKLFGTDSKLEKAEFQLEKWKKFTKNNGKGWKREGKKGETGERGKKERERTIN